MPKIEPLVLEILSHGSSLEESIFEQKEAASTLRRYSPCPLDFSEINKLTQEAALILSKADKSGGLQLDAFQRLKKTGQLLWNHLLTRPIKERLKQTYRCNLTLSLDEELVHIPWELLYDGDNFLCLSFNLGRLVRTKEDFTACRYRGFSSKLKMLILVNPTDDLKSAYIEGINIKNQFDRRRNNVHIDFKSTNIDKLYLKKNLCDYDIVHFAGHCEYDLDRPADSGWVLKDGRFTGRDILTIAQTLSLPTLVFSNACYSGRLDSAAVADMDYQERNYNLASAFLFSGVRHYIGAIRRIEDSLSFEFAREFYSQLISGKPVGECMRLSRLKLTQGCELASVPWASYLLYGDPNFILFKSHSLAVAPEGKRKFSLATRHLRKFILGLGILCLGIYLYMWLPSINLNTYRLYLSANSAFKKGQNNEVISLAGRIITKDPAFLSVYPLLGEAYQRMGDRKNGLRYYFAYALLAEKRQDSKSLISAYIKIGWLYHLEAKYEKAAAFYHKALSLSRQTKDKLNEALALRKLAVWYIDKENYNRALELLTKSSEINRQRQHLFSYRYNLACDYFDLGLVFSNKNDLSAAQDFYQRSLQLFEGMKLKNELSDYYFNLGELYLFQKQYQKAKENYLRGLKVDQEQNNQENLASDYNMLGQLYVQMENLTAAEAYFQQAELVSGRINAQGELADSYYNLGLLYKRLGKKNKAREFLRLAQEIYREIDLSTYQKIKQEFQNLAQ